MHKANGLSIDAIDFVLTIRGPHFPAGCVAYPDGGELRSSGNSTNPIVLAASLIFDDICTEQSLIDAGIHGMQITSSSDP